MVFKLIWYNNQGMLYRGKKEEVTYQKANRATESGSGSDLLGLFSSPYIAPSCFVYSLGMLSLRQNKKPLRLLVRKQTIPTDRLPLLIKYDLCL
jgi:hypothetical protein